jgi:hypothetical protein
MTSSIVPPERPLKPAAKPVSAGPAAPSTPGSEPASGPQDGLEEGAPATWTQPFCIDCAEIAFNALERSNDELGEDERESRDQLRLRAKLAARKVRFCGEWVCPRCAQIDIGSWLTPQLVALGAVLPNRESRRSFERWTRPHARLSEEGLR